MPRKKQPLAFQTVVVEVTEACHHRCLHCYNYWRDEHAPIKASDTLSRAEILSLIRKVQRDTPLRQVALSGGEPLLRRDLPEIATDLVTAGLEVMVITSGTLLDDEKLKRFPSGTGFEFTLFGVTAGLHDRIAGRPGAFAKVIRGIQCAGRHGFPLALTCVVNRLNAHEVLETIELGIALKAQAVLFNRMNLSRSTLPVADQLVPSIAQLRQALDAADEAAQRYGISVAVSVPIPPCLIDISRYRNLHFGWCPRGDEGAYYTIGHNGLIRPCNHSSVVLGNLRKERFADIVMSESARAFWQPVPAACQSCEHPLKDSCRGGCLAASHECYGSADLIDPFVAHCLSASSPQPNVDFKIPAA
jgi:radical SAM protein with 4Fe4S-binding SPASM domain